MRSRPEPRPLGRSAPWGLADVELVGALLLAGGGLVVGSWFGASGEVTLEGQIGWANLGVGGLLAVGCGVLLWLLHGRRAVGQLRREVLQAIAADLDAGAVATAGVAVGVGVAPVADPVAGNGRSAAGGVELVALAGASRFHRPTCPLVAGKPTLRATAARRRSLRPCGVCEPNRSAELG